ncbi:hypothetical protein A8C32_13855 [Flavivirga aquatica]|uniref:DUF547 domain-containing protein n=1 Tax=Flavivirga aquatica TaxID=1849968 RepID=A0A1E5TCN5_9FLAO|nr:hypothetical protein A8C32_13855 [Flavivirga aquatica]
MCLLFLFFSWFGYSQSIDNSNLRDFLKKHVSIEGFVNYEKLVRNKEDLQIIVDGFSKVTPNSSWSLNELKAYWINVYNINVLKLLSGYYPLKSIKYIDEPFKVEFINVNGIMVSLEYLETVIIKEMGDPRMYFALNNTCVSSPKLNRAPYIAESIDSELENSAKNFVNDTSKNYFSKTADEATLSPLFEWHSSEFIGDYELISFINKYSETKKISTTTKISYSSFDWNLNKENF